MKEKRTAALVADWQKIKIGEFLFERTGRYKPDDKMVIGLKRVEKIDFSGNFHIAQKPSRTDMILVRQGDLVISGINVAKGAMGIYNGDEAVTATIHYSSYTFDTLIIDVEYFKRFLKSAKFISLLQEQVKGGIKTEIKPKHLLPLDVPLPPIEKQKEIVKHFKSIETEDVALKAELTHQQALLKKLRAQILTEAIAGTLTTDWRGQNPDVEPASELLKRIQAEKAQLIKAKKIKAQKPLPPISEADKPFALPDRWAWCRLGNISINSLGKMLDAQKNKGESKPYIRNFNVQWFEINTSNLKKMPFEKHETEKYSVIRGDIIICEGGYPGRSAIWQKNEPVMFQKALHRLRFISKCFPPVLFVHVLWLWDKNGKLKNYYTGAGIKHLTGKSLNKILIPLPPLSEQKAIVSKVEKLLSLCDQLEVKIKQNQIHAEGLMQAVLREAFS